MDREIIKTGFPLFEVELKGRKELVVFDKPRENELLFQRI